MNHEQLDKRKRYNRKKIERLKEVEQAYQKRAAARAAREEERQAPFAELGKRNEANKQRAKLLANLRPSESSEEDTLVVIEEGDFGRKSAVIARVKFNSIMEIGKITFWEILPTGFSGGNFGENDAKRMELDILRDMRGEGNAIKLAEEKTYEETFMPSAYEGDYIVPSESIHGRSFNPIDAVVRSRRQKKAEVRIGSFEESLELIENQIQIFGQNPDLLEEYRKIVPSEPTAQT